MSAIINNSFRKFNADNFISSFVGNNVYLTIGKNTEWSGASAGEYIEQAPNDATIPVPIDTTTAYYKNHDDLIAVKKISSADVSHVIKRVNWTTNTRYAEYDHLQDDMIDGVKLDVNGLPDPAGILTDYFVMNATFKVYKCISNYGGALSVNEPTNTQTGVFETPDHYKWKFMYEVQQADVVKFVTSDWIPIKAPANAIANPDQAAVESAAIDGSIEHINVVSGGTLYKNNTGNAVGSLINEITLASGTGQSWETNHQTDDYYNNMTVYIRAGKGVGQLRTITDYDGASETATITPNWDDVNSYPDSTSVYDVMPAVTLASVDNNDAFAHVSRINISTGAIEAVAMKAEGTLYRSGTATVSSGAPASGGTAAVLKVMISPKGGHGSNAVNELGGAFVMLNSRLIGIEGGDFPVGADFRKVQIIINPELAGGGLATGSVYQQSELTTDTGDIIYSEFRGPINRASDSTEDIKIVCEF